MHTKCDKYVFHLFLYQDKMVYRYAFRNDARRQGKRNRFCMMYMIIHSMMCSSDKYHGKEDIGKWISRERNQVNRKQHMHDIEDTDIC